MSGSGKNGDGDDENLWIRLTQNVTPLKGPRKAAPRPRGRSIVKTAESGPRETAAPAPHAPEKKGREIDRRTAERLESGRMKPQARLDLHGLNRAQARERLEDFIRRAYDADLRLLLVITGKGRQDGDRLGILRESVPAWLEEPPLRAIVLRSSPAKPRHGGGGALYVLLRRKRPVTE